jgi:hypothetical protein
MFTDGSKYHALPPSNPEFVEESGFAANLDKPDLTGPKWNCKYATYAVSSYCNFEKLRKP